MNHQEFDERIHRRWNRRRSERGRIWVGIFLLIAGGLFLARAGGVLFPGWFFTWPVLLIGIGLFSGFRHGFRGIGWLFPLAVGAVFLADNLSTDINLRPYLWPIILITAGAFILFRPRRSRGFFPCNGQGPRSGNNANEADGEVLSSTENNYQPAANDRNNVIDATAVFAGVKKNMISKQFRGGDVTTFMGGAEINLTQADFEGRAVIDCFNMFGGTKLIIPPDWEVQSDVVAIFGGVDDKRPPQTTVASNKVLYLDGTCLFGGLEIKSF